MMEDDLQPRAATAPARVKRLTRSTLKRLTAIPPHKTQRNTRHYPIVPPVPGSNTGLQLRGLDERLKGRGHTDVFNDAAYGADEGGAQDDED